MPTRDEICEFVYSVLGNDLKDELELFTICDATAQKIKKATGSQNVKGYKVVITGDYVRHVYNGHKDDIDLICELENIIKNFDRVEKSIEIDRITKRNAVCLVFEKKILGEPVRAVKLRDFKSKRLSLKTIFRKD